MQQDPAALLALGLAWFVVFLFSTTLHEAAHAWAALRLGDPTAYQGGQVSLNPIPHIRREPWGMVLVPLLSFFFLHWMIGWASAPYDPRWANRHPRRAAIMALAGPASNLSLVLVAGLIMRIGLGQGWFQPPALDQFQVHRLVEAGSGGGGALTGIAAVLSITFTLNLVLWLFNLIPLPPLDGSGALPLVLPENWVASYRELLAQPMVGWLGLLVAWRIFDFAFGYVFPVAITILYA